MDKVRYGNWVPSSLFVASSILLILVSIFCGLAISVWHSIVLTVVAAIIMALLVLFIVYMAYCHRRFSCAHGGLMDELHQFLLNHLSWDGVGTALDIGCGAGALSIRCAKTYTDAHVVGMDYWGKGWGYDQAQCEHNARVEGVAERIRFEHGDAAHLGYDDGYFDAALSNFVFHEVHTADDKRDVVREALRVVRPGGAFAFQDMFGQAKLYGDMDEFLDQLRNEGVTEIHYRAQVDKLDMIPCIMRAPWMLHGVGVLYGIK